MNFLILRFLDKILKLFKNQFYIIKSRIHDVGPAEISNILNLIFRLSDSFFSLKYLIDLTTQKIFSSIPHYQNLHYEINLKAPFVIQVIKIRILDLFSPFYKFFDFFFKFFYFIYKYYIFKIF